MKNSRNWAALAAAFVFGACSSSDDPAPIDQNLANAVDTINDCLAGQSGLQSKLDALLDIARLWNQRDTTNPPDPAGLTFSITGAPPQIDVTLVLPGTTCTFSMTILAYQQDGTPATPVYGAPTSLSQAIDNGATSLRNQFPNTKPFFVGSWTASGATAANLPLSGSGAFTGIIQGTLNGNELEELRTTTATPAGGTPPIANGVITIGGAAPCTLRFSTASLKTDTIPDQDFPIGSVSFVVEGPKATTNATLVFDNTSTARLTVDGVPGRFDINLITFEVTYVQV